jgi:hypothetical protein
MEKEPKKNPRGAGRKKMFKVKSINDLRQFTRKVPKEAYQDVKNAVDIVVKDYKIINPEKDV